MLVRAKCEKWGGRFVPFDIVPDRRDAIEAALERAVEVADIVVVNAGSSSSTSSSVSACGSAPICSRRAFCLTRSMLALGIVPPTALSYYQFFLNKL